MTIAWSGGKGAGAVAPLCELQDLIALWCALPITALSSVYGMNIIVNDRTDFSHLAVVLVVMAAMSATLLRWAKRQGWW
jgi:hypothetical protein